MHLNLAGILHYSGANRIIPRAGEFRMRPTLAGVIALFVVATPAWAKLEIVKIEAAHGMLGPERKSLEIYPLEEVFFRYQVAGVKTDADGKTDVETVMRLVNPNGKTVFEEKPAGQRQLSLGGATYPAYAVLNVPPAEKAPPGEYKFTVLVRDRHGSETASFERQITVKAVAFQIINPRFSRDPEGKIPSIAGGMVGESLYLKLRVIGFDKSKKKVQTMLTINVLGEDGKDTQEKPRLIKAELTNPDDAAKATQVNYNSLLYLNRPGTFTLKLTVEDVAGKQTTVFETPLKVSAP
jgi:hypothetical protein